MKIFSQSVRVYVLVFSALFYFSHASSAEPANCTKIEQGFDVRFCVDEPPNASKTLVYYLHGAGGSEMFWFDDFFYTGQIRRYWSKNFQSRPTVVSVSFDFTKYDSRLGRRWLLVPRNSKSDLSGLLEFFEKTLVPLIEGKLQLSPEKRYVFGESMGGFNSSLLALKTNLFQKAAIICAPMSEQINPFSEADDQLDYMKSTIAWDYYGYIKNGHEIVKSSVLGMNQLLKKFVPSVDLWSDVDPIQLAAKARPNSNPKFYVTAGAYDPYLAYEGSQRFSEILTSKGISSEWRPQWGGHCAIDIPSLATFLAH